MDKVVFICDDFAILERGSFLCLESVTGSAHSLGATVVAGASSCEGCQASRVREACSTGQE